MKQSKQVFLFLLAVAAGPCLHAQVTFNPIPSRIVGQPILQQIGVPTATAPNLVEGRELSSPQSVAVDNSSTPHAVYVADLGNNRVLVWKDASTLTKGNFADKVIGQRDFYSVQAKGPGTDLTTGLALPVAVAVDSAGNLYVVDAGNNRIVRYPSPLKQTSDLLSPDLVIGQHDITGNRANEGNAKPTAKTLLFSGGNGVFRSGLAFDSQGNLWVSDAGNNRVLRFAAGSLSAGNNEPAADTVLGQIDFSTSTITPGVNQSSKTFLASPSGLAFDPQGRLYVADQGSSTGGRVLVYAPPLNSGQPAARIMGVVLPSQAAPNPPAISPSTLGSPNSPPEGIFFAGNTPYVVDTGNARILKFDSFDNWPIETTAFSPAATAVIGQADFTSNRSNAGLPQPGNATFSGPVQAHTAFEVSGAVAGVVSGTDVFISDAGNNRILIFPLRSDNTFSAANRVIGQVDFQYNSPNLIEGREFYFQGFGGSSVIDYNSNPPHLYVSDPGNNRVLGFLDYRQVKPGSKADLVIGQPDFYTGILNYPKNDPSQLNDQGLAVPEGVAVDSTGNLYIADAGNARVLRFANPFLQAPGVMPRANLVLGQSGFFIKITDASAATMRAPYGLAFTSAGNLLVSDTALNRVLYFVKQSGGDFSSSQAAKSVIGQPDFGPPSEASLNGPRLISVDSDDRLYVADTGNGRIAIYRNVPTAGNDPAISFSLTGLNQPFGVAANFNTGEIWVADTNNNRAVRYPQFNTLVLNPTFTVSIPSSGPFSVTLDPFGNPVLTEAGTNRVAFFYPEIDNTSAAGGIGGRFSGNGANYFLRFAPGMLASIFSFQNTHFGLDTAGATSVPLPTTLSDIQVLVAGTAAPLLYVSPGQINLQIPSATPVGSLPVEFQVLRASTGQILASGLFRIDPVSPGLFTADSTGSGQLLALNQDGTINSGTHPAKAGTFISLFGTGTGVVNGAPPDGTPVPSGQILSTNDKPQVYINASLVPDSDVQFSGLAPGFVGLWQINVKVPTTVPTPDVAVPVAILYEGINSRLDQFGTARSTTIRTTP